MEKRGEIVVLTGGMFSGKTEMLIRELRREGIAKRKVVLFRPVLDVRYSADNKVVTHNMDMSFPATITPIDKSAHKFIIERASGYDVVGLEESQFFEANANISGVAVELANSGKHVFAVSLNRDHWGIPYENTMKLLGNADRIENLTAICGVCGGENATFSQMVNEKRGVIFMEGIKVAGLGTYEARCRKDFVFPDPGMLLRRELKLKNIS